MNNIKLYNVSPRMPRELKFLERLSYNMWWCWHPAAIELFVRINPSLWRELEGNCRKFLGMIPQSRLEALAHDSDFLRMMHVVEAEFSRQIPPEEQPEKAKIGYFSMEYGIHESVRLYSGGLGVLSGDHLKAASDLRLPLVAVGLLYRQGYFRQLLDRNGWQLERYPENEIHNMPVTRVTTPDGSEVTISIPILDRQLYATVWRLRCGSVDLMLLDTEIPENPPEFREITWRLYGGDKRMRLMQELLLGIGGFKALIASGYDPEICHMNEGHAAFLSLARLEHLTKDHHYDVETALEMVWRSNVFTTHTPVPAGNEVFEIGMVRPYLEPFCRQAGVDVDRIINWGVPIADRNRSGEMSMTVLGLRLANYSNAVSKLHGEVARNMWRHLWPGRAIDEIPIRHITNGVHIHSWVSSRKRVLLDRYIPADWTKLSEEALGEAVEQIPDDEFWAVHELCRHSLVRRVRRMQQSSLTGMPVSKVQTAGHSVLDPNILTFGFARRFATYKRGTLLLRNPERLLALLRNEQHPVQFIFAGKAHPADEGGKRLIQQLVQFAETNHVSDRLVFLEDYDIGLARFLVQGVDVWLNTPKRPQEASGTSGMKAAANGVLNCSILDGWWAEAYHPDCGWAIPSNDNYEDPEDADNLESQELFNIIESEIIPCFYERSNEIPVRWIEMMKRSLTMAFHCFSSNRMVAQYNDMFYKVACETYEKLTAADSNAAQLLVEQKKRMVDHFGGIEVENPTVDRDLNTVHVGDSFRVSTNVFLNGMTPQEVAVEVYYGQVNVHNEIVSSDSQAMTMAEDLGNHHYRYETVLACTHPGRFGLTARVTPVGSEWDNSIPGFMSWPK